MMNKNRNNSAYS